MVEFLESWINQYPIVSLEDGLAQEDWDGWKALTAQIGDKVQLVGDDLLVTNPKFVKRAIEEKACNALLVKVNQIGSLSETIEAVKLCQRRRMGHGHFTPLRGDRRQHHRRPVGGTQHGPDQDRRASPLRPYLQIQSIIAH